MVNNLFAELELKQQIDPSVSDAIVLIFSLHAGFVWLLSPLCSFARVHSECFDDAVLCIDARGHYLAIGLVLFNGKPE